MVQNDGTKKPPGGVLETSMPALPSNTYRTANGYQFRLVVPEPLRELIGKREIKHTLSSDYRAASREARLLAVQAGRLIDEARDTLAARQAPVDGLAAYLAQPVDKRLKPITTVTPELIAGLRALWLSSLDADLAWRQAGISEEDYNELSSNIATNKAHLAQALSRGDIDAFIPMVRQLVHLRGYELCITESEERRLVYEFLPAVQHGYDLLERRQAGRLETPEPSDVPPLPAVWEPAPSATAGMTWEQLFDHWRNDRERPANTVYEATRVLAMLRQRLPKHTAPTTLTRAQVVEWLRFERDDNGNSPATLAKKANLVGAMFSMAVKDELLDKNPFAHLDHARFAPKKGVENPDGRRPFTAEELQRIFSADGVFSASSRGGGGYHARVWIPILALYTGMRLDEICSLTVDDVLTSPVAHLVVRQGKTQSSVRKVPLHPELVSLGFLPYVASLRQAGKKSLWPELKGKNAQGVDSRVAGKAFTNMKQRLGLPVNVVFHSFRHTFKDVCRNALISREIHHALTGHEMGTSVGDTYGDGFSIAVLAEQVGKITVGVSIPAPLPYPQ